MILDIDQLIKMGGEQWEYELVVPDYITLNVGNLMYFNENKYIYTGELLEVEVEDDDGNIASHNNVYYFRRIFF
jgi:hypothetical protein